MNVKVRHEVKEASRSLWGYTTEVDPGIPEAPVTTPEQQLSYLEAEKFIFCCVHDVADLWKQRNEDKKGDRKTVGRVYL